MSKPWFLDVAEDPAAEAMREQIKKVIGRDLGDARSVVQRAKEEGKDLENGEGVGEGVDDDGDEAAPVEPKREVSIYRDGEDGEGVNGFSGLTGVNGKMAVNVTVETTQTVEEVY